jgi:hypothetical protein
MHSDNNQRASSYTVLESNLNLSIFGIKETNQNTNDYENITLPFNFMPAHSTRS